MIVLGIILVLIAAAIGLLGVWAASQASGPALTTTILNSSFNVSPLMLFVGGMVAMVLLWLGIRLLGFGTRRTVSKRRERKELLRTQAEQEAALLETQRKLGTTQQARQEEVARLEAAREEERTREAQLRIEADRRRTEGREDEVRRLAAEREAGRESRP
ncbi:MAG: hypothetical protein IPI32_08155 [Austwickia sp.]|jgi:hypothetical protein|nr:hypothetical protein [Austwickia sp.]MBK8436545.1 hypothetical protein [Austwickia sp.]MBK9102223.1 hypothetical protein [Austwickia sp.]